ncbi:MaoC family dehydratase [Microbacterium sp. A93]|uniref:MaoC family dehydratase n=1 Tax=Microbacterium sp. A93 TaxID=3450716 RepID=UPI003F43EB29
MSITVGTELPVYEVLVDRQPMKTMAALLGDPNPIHWDPRATAELGMGDRPVNQGPLNMGYLMTMLTGWAGGRDRILSFRVRFMGNVLAEDRVRATGTVTAVRATAAGRVADCDLSLDVVDGEAALVGTASVLIEPSHEGTDRPANESSADPKEGDG